MSEVILVIVFIALITAMTVYSLKGRGGCSMSCRCRCPYDETTECETMPLDEDDGKKSSQSDQ